MRRVLASVLTTVTLFVVGGQANPPIPDNGDDNRLIDYIESNEINSYEDFIDVIRVLSPESVDENEGISDIDSFNIDIDYDNMLVSVITERYISYGKSSSAGRGVSKSYYTSDGIIIFTVSVEGTFSYSSGTCTTTSARGSFSRTGVSLWSSTPLITSGNINAKIAYARISGTATSGSESVYYSLTLTCNDSGSFTSY